MFEIIKKFFSKSSRLDSLHDFMTDAATFAILDPAINEMHRDDEQWWIDYDQPLLKEIVQGKAVFLNLGADGGYKVRMADSQGLTDLEKQYCISCIKGLGVEVTSGHLHLGGAEYVTSSSLKDCADTICVKVPNGQYDLTIYGIETGSFYAREDQEALKIRNTIPDVVVSLKVREEPFKKFSQDIPELLPLETPYVYSQNERYKYEPAKTIFKPGDLLYARVIKKAVNRVHHLEITRPSYGSWPKECLQEWPYGYNVILKDMSRVDWLNYIVIAIDEVDETSKTITCHFVEKIADE